jgi:hypothetical protein
MHSIQMIGFLTDIRESAIVYPVIMTTHLACIAVFGGLIVMTDLRLLGLALKDYKISEVVNGLRPWKHLGGTLMITMGLLLGTSEGDKYYINPFFWTKMALLLCVAIHALIFRPLVYKRAKDFDDLPTIPGQVKAAGALSLIIWFGIMTMGRLIGYYEPKQTQPAAVIHTVAPPAEALRAAQVSPQMHRQ